MNEMREEFEVWANGFYHYPLDMSRDVYGHYAAGLTAEKFAIWKAGHQSAASAEYLTYVEAAIKDAGYEIRHDGGPLGEANVRLVRKRDREADRQRFRDPKFNAYLDQAITENGEFTTWHQIDNVVDAWYGYQAGLHDASPSPFDSQVDLEQFRDAVEWAKMTMQDAADSGTLNQGMQKDALDSIKDYDRLLALIDKAAQP